MPEVEPLPAGACLVHIGPHKTGTSAVQGAFHLARKDLRRQGVRYLGRGRTPAPAVQSVVGSRPMRGDAVAPEGAWARIAGQADVGSRRRSAISSEFFADAGPDEIRGIVDDLGPDRVHVVVTLRRLDRIAPSQWQQYVQNGATVTMSRWLKGMLLREPYRRPTPSFWRRHRHDKLVERWCAVVGADRVTIIVVDDADPTDLTTTFERLLGLAPQTLRAPGDEANRSLTSVEVELIRRTNRAFRRRHWSGEVYKRYVRLGATRQMKARRPDPREARPQLPRWAVVRLREISLDVVAGLRGTGVRVVGDLDDLVVPEAPAVVEPPDPGDPASAQVGARALIGAIAASDPRGGTDRDRLLAGVPTRQLATELRRRLLRRDR